MEVQPRRDRRTAPARHLEASLSEGSLRWKGACKPIQCLAPFFPSSLPPSLPSSHCCTFLIEFVSVPRFGKQELVGCCVYCDIVQIIQQFNSTSRKSNNPLPSFYRYIISVESSAMQWLIPIFLLRCSNRCLDLLLLPSASPANFLSSLSPWTGAIRCCSRDRV